MRCGSPDAAALLSGAGRVADANSLSRLGNACKRYADHYSWIAMPPRVANPFRFGALARDEAFTDRDEEIAELAADARNGQDVVILAPRRFGKTSLVDRVQQRLVRDKVLVGQVNLMRAPTKEKLAEKLAAVIHDDIAGPLAKAKDFTTRVFRGLRISPTMTIDPQTGA